MVRGRSPDLASPMARRRGTPPPCSPGASATTSSWKACLDIGSFTCANPRFGRPTRLEAREVRSQHGEMEAEEWIRDPQQRAVRSEHVGVAHDELGAFQLGKRVVERRVGPAEGRSHTAPGRLAGRDGRDDRAVQGAVYEGRVLAQEVLSLPEERVGRVEQPLREPVSEVGGSRRGGPCHEIAIPRRATQHRVHEQGHLEVANPPERTGLAEVERPQGHVEHCPPAQRLLAGQERGHDRERGSAKDEPEGGVTSEPNPVVGRLDDRGQLGRFPQQVRKLVDHERAARRLIGEGSECHAPVDEPPAGPRGQAGERGTGRREMLQRGRGLL